MGDEKSPILVICVNVRVASHFDVYTLFLHRHLIIAVPNTGSLSISKNARQQRLPPLHRLASRHNIDSVYWIHDQIQRLDSPNSYHHRLDNQTLTWEKVYQTYPDLSVNIR